MSEELTKDMPLVSIVIPVYNGSNYLNQAINSALAQTYENIEVLIIDDGSTDGGLTANVAKAYGNRIRYYRKENGGVATALNMGIQMMKGDYFSWLSHDDMYTPDKIESEVTVIKEFGQCVVGCNILVVGSDGTLLRKNQLSKQKEKGTKCFLALDTDTGINGCALLIPKCCFEECGGFKPDLKCTQDYDMWFRIAERYPFHYTDNFGVLSRQHEAQDSKTKTLLCTEEADKLHSYFLRNITVTEMKRFIGEDTEYLYKRYMIYRNAGYLKTAAQISMHIWSQEGYFQKDSKIIDEILAEISGYDKGTIVSQFQNQIKELGTKEKKQQVIMFYSNVWTRGGIERVLSILLPGLIDEYQIILISNHIENEEGFPLPKEVVHIKLDAQLNEKLPYSLLVLALLLKVDIFVGNPNIIYTFLNVYPLMEENGIKTIVCNHGSYFIPYWSKWIYNVAEKRKEVYPVASAVTWLTSFSTQLGKRLSENSVLLPNPNTYERQKQKINIGQNKNILVVGRFYDSIKRVDRTLRVFREVVKRHRDAKLYLVGGYDLEMHIPLESPYSIKELLQQLDLPKKSVVWVGEVEEPARYYEMASLLMLTSENEGFGMVLNEAGVYGIPQVSFEFPGINDIVRDGENGYIVPQDDIIGMAEKIVFLLENPGLLQKMSIQAQKYADRFNKSIIVDKWKSLFNLVLKTNRKEDLNKMLQESFPYPHEMDITQLKQIVNNYNTQVQHITGSKPSDFISQEHATEDKNIKICDNCQRNLTVKPCDNCREVIYQSNSWRITKPFRWISLTLKSLKNNGIVCTVKKIRQRFILKLHKE